MYTRFGIVTVYAHRPHVHQAAYLANALKQAGREVRFLSCDGAVRACHGLLLKDAGRLTECTSCTVGGVRSFFTTGISSARGLTGEWEVGGARAREIARSTVERVLMTEGPSDRGTTEYEEMLALLEPSVSHFYKATREWIQRERLDALLLYNGRMDLTRAALEAVRDAGLPFVTVEAAWTGHGIAFTPNDMCLSLVEVDRIVGAFRDVPLTAIQARIAAKIVASRFLRRNTLEWRVYNQGAVGTPWPGPAGAPRILVLPSSRNEVEGHRDWTAEWSFYPEAFDRAIQQLGGPESSVVIRCHPNWSEPYGRRTGANSEQAYTAWARERGYALIPSRDKADTYPLLDEADLVLVNGSTAGLEAAVRGKRVICLGSTWYRNAGFAEMATTWDELHSLGAQRDRIAPEVCQRRVLRYVYSYARRVTQFAREVRALDASTRSFGVADLVPRLDEMLRSGRVTPDDATVAETQDEEDAVLAEVVAGRWGALYSWEEPLAPTRAANPRRLLPVRWIDQVRRLRPVGDRA